MTRFFRASGAQVEGEGVGQDGDALSLANHGQGLVRGKPELADVTGALIAQVFIESLLDAADGTGFHEGPGDVGPAHLAAAGDLLHPGHGDGNIQGIEFGDDLGVAVDPGLLEHRQTLVQKPIMILDKQPHDMHGAARTLGADLHPGDNLHPETLPCRHGFGQAVNGIMVGQRHGRKAPLFSLAHHLRRGIRAVRGSRMDM